MYRFLILCSILALVGCTHHTPGVQHSGEVEACPSEPLTQSYMDEILVHLYLVEKEGRQSQFEIFEKKVNKQGRVTGHTLAFRNEFNYLYTVEWTRGVDEGQVDHIQMSVEYGESGMELLVDEDGDGCLDEGRWHHDREDWKQSLTKWTGRTATSKNLENHAGWQEAYGGVLYTLFWTAQ